MNFTIQRLNKNTKLKLIYIIPFFSSPAIEDNPLILVQETSFPFISLSEPISVCEPTGGYIAFIKFEHLELFYFK